MEVTRGARRRAYRANEPLDCTQSVPVTGSNHVASRRIPFQSAHHTLSMVQRTQEKGKQGDQTASAEAQDTQNALNTIATFARDALLTQRYYALLAVLALVFEAALTLLIIKKVPYTEIDFSTYMQQVDVFLKGQRDYTLISGDTGPCVYPAGHVYAYSLVHRLTDGGKDLQLAQYLFAALYLTSQALVFGLYYLAEVREGVVG